MDDMNDFVKKILEYKEENKYSSEACAKKIGISIEEMKEIEGGKTSIDPKVQEEIMELLDRRKRRPTRVLELLFKFGATIMALLVLLLAIDGSAKSNTMFVLLSLGLLCLSIQNLPKIDKD